MKKLAYIDALRGLAILGVLMVHTREYGHFNVPDMIGNVIGQGARGVQLFYLVSAFTLFLSFKNRKHHEKFPIRNFFLRRLFRIAPIYYIGICYYLFQDGLGPRYWLGDETQITTSNIVSNFLFLHAFNPYWITSVVPGGWSIGVEMTFYAVLPLVLARVKNLNQAFSFFIFSILAKLILQIVFMRLQLISDDRLWGEYLFLYFPSQLPVFCLGVLLYFTLIEGEGLGNVSAKSVFFFSCLMLVQLGTGTHIIFSNHILFGIGFLLFAFALSVYPTRIIVNTIISYIGKISFSMYIVHFAVLHWLSRLTVIDCVGSGALNFLLSYFIVSVLTIIIASLLYYTIELPTQELGKRIIIRLEKGTNT